VVLRRPMGDKGIFLRSRGKQPSTRSVPRPVNTAPSPEEAVGTPELLTGFFARGPHLLFSHKVHELGRSLRQMDRFENCRLSMVCRRPTRDREKCWTQNEKTAKSKMQLRKKIGYWPRIANSSEQLGTPNQKIVAFDIISSRPATFANPTFCGPRVPLTTAVHGAAG
jgi:hypothetical protein